MSRATVTAALIFILSSPCPAHGQQGAGSDSVVTGLLENRIAAGRTAGLAVGVTGASGTRFLFAGSADDAGTPISANTIFEIGSISKAFTGILLADMVLRGEVSLNDTVESFLPDGVNLPEFEGRKIILGDLATARSGLPSIPPIEELDLTDPYRDFTTQKLYSFLSGYTLTRAPGSRYEYSNIGMGLLGHVLSLRAGRPYQELVRELVLEPLGMNETMLEVPPALQGRVATGHDHNTEPTGPWNFDVLAPAGGWRSTIGDMSRFMEAVVHPGEGRLGDAIRMATTPLADAGRDGLGIGLAWHLLERDGRLISWHNGETGGFHSMLAVDPLRGLGAVVLSNSAAPIDDIGFHLVDPTIPLASIPAPREVVEVAETALAGHEGSYELVPGVIIEVTVDGGNLHARITGQPRYRVFPVSDNRFFYRVVEAELEFVVDDTGTTTGLILHQNGRQMPARRVDGQ